MAAEGFVGRHAELATLRDALSVAIAGDPTIVLLLGAPGIGKTRLADEAAALGRSAGLAVIHAEADESIREPMELWRGVARSLHVDLAVDPTLPTAERRWEHLDALVAGLRAAEPVVVVLDDLHWADDMAVWVLEHLPRALGEAPVLFVAMSRDREPDMPALDALRRRSRVVPVGGLDVESVRQLAAAHPGRAVDVVDLHARTGGNPLLVRELLLSGDGDVVSGVLDRALQRLDPASRRLLAIAAVAGAGTPLAVVAAAGETTAADAARRLTAAVDAGVLDDVSPAGVVFHHSLFAEAARRAAAPQELHARLAVTWAAIGGVDGRAAAALHRLGAAADVDAAADAVVAALDAATELVRTDQQPRAAALLREAVAVSAACAGRPDLRATALLARAELLAELGDYEVALEDHQEAARVARGGDDPVVRARAEVGGALHLSPFLPDPARVRRLEEALAALPQDEPRLRVALLGRLAVVGGADLDAADRARVWADEAVELARQVDDPVLIAQSLLERHIAPRLRAELDEQLRAATEVIAMAERGGRGDLAVQGHQWRFSNLLNHGDLSAASDALDRAELLSQLLPSPAWRYSALIRRTTVHALRGHRALAAATMLEAASVGEGAVDRMAVVGFEVGHRQMLVDLFGGTDPVAAELYEQQRDVIGAVPVPFLQVQFAKLSATVGDLERVDAVLHRYAGDPARVLRSLGGDALLRILAEIVVARDATAFADPVYGALLPFAGLLNAFNGGSLTVPVDDLLGRLALLRSDPGTAVRHAADAVALCRAMPAPPMLVHCLDHLADALERTAVGEPGPIREEANALAASIGVERPDAPPAPTGARRARTATMRRDGAGWLLDSPLGRAEVADSNGVRQLARLLSAPGAEVAATELAGATAVPVANDLGPALDGRAKRAYRQRLHELQAEVDDAAACHDPVRGERAQIEIDALLRELERAVGLGGRDRPTGSGAERARINVTRSINRAIEAIRGGAFDLGAHLAVSVRTGRFCSYAPEPAAAVSWTVEP